MKVPDNTVPKTSFLKKKVRIQDTNSLLFTTASVYGNQIRG